MKKSKKFKGMTLVEIIISLAVLAVLTLVLVQTSDTINMYIKSANRVNHKTVQQAPVAEIGQKEAGELVKEDVVIKVNGIGSVSFSQNLQGDAYRVKDSSPDEIGGDLNMQYIVDLEAVTEAPGP